MTWSREEKVGQSFQRENRGSQSGYKHVEKGNEKGDSSLQNPGETLFRHLEELFKDSG